MRIKIVCELVRKEGETVGCMYSEEIGRQSEMMIGKSTSTSQSAPVFFERRGVEIT